MGKIFGEATNVAYAILNPCNLSASLRESIMAVRILIEAGSAAMTLAGGAGGYHYPINLQSTIFLGLQAANTLGALHITAALLGCNISDETWKI